MRFKAMLQENYNGIHDEENCRFVLYMKDVNNIPVYGRIRDSYTKVFHDCFLKELTTNEQTDEHMCIYVHY